MNSIVLTGNLTKDIELRHTKNGVAVATFNLGVRRDYKNENGEYESDFPSCIAYKQTAEYLSKYAKKGDKIEVAGRLQTRTYEKDGEKRYVTEVIVEKGSMLNRIEKQAEKKVNPYEEFGKETGNLPF